MSVDERVRSQITEHTRFRELCHLAEVDSTNRWVRDRADQGAAEGLVAVADHQTAGRGRLGRTWTSPVGASLLASVLLRPTGLAPDRLHLVTAATGLAAAAACRDVGGFDPAIKWPNDLLVDDRKLAGILADSGGGAVVVGIGLNLSEAPPGAACAAEAAGHPVSRDAILASFLVHLDSLLGDWDRVASEYARSCATVGRLVRVELPGEVVEGFAEAVDAGGRLCVRAEGADEPLWLSAGDVVHLRGR